MTKNSASYENALAHGLWVSIRACSVHTNTCHLQKTHRGYFFKRIIYSSILIPLSDSPTNGSERHFAAYLRRHTFLGSSSIAFCSTSATTGLAG